MVQGVESLAVRATPMVDYPLSGSMEDSLAKMRLDLDRQAPDDPQRHESINAFAVALFERFKQFQKIEDLENSIIYFREFLALRPPGFPFRPKAFFQLGVALYTRFQSMGKPEDLDEAIMHHRDALELRKPPHDFRAQSLNFLGQAVYTRYTHTHSIGDLDEVIICLSEEYDLRTCGSHDRLGAQAPDDPQRHESINALAVALFERFKQCQKIEDLENSIIYSREFLALRPPGFPSRPKAFFQLGVALYTRFQSMGKPEDLDEAIMHHRDALELRKPPHDFRAQSLNCLGQAVYTRYTHSHSVGDLDEAIICFSEEFDLRTCGSQDRLDALSYIAFVTNARFQKLGKTEDLENVVTYHREAIALHPPGNLRLDHLTSLASALSTLFKRRASAEDLDEAIKYHLEVLDLTPPGNPKLASSLHNLGASLLDRFEISGISTDLANSIIHLSDALKLRPHSDPKRTLTLDSLAASMTSRYKSSKNSGDLDAAINYRREALSAPNIVDHYALLNNIASNLHQRFEILGNIEDLNEAIEKGKDALALLPPDAPSRFLTLSVLGGAIMTRFEQLGKVEDMEQAIKYQREAIEVIPSNHIKRAGCLSNLAGAVSNLFEQSGRITHLSEAINYYHQALQVPGAVRQYITMSNLGLALCTRFQRTKEMKDLEDAISYHSQVIDHCPHDHHLRSNFLNNIAHTLAARFKAVGREDDLHHAIKYYHEVLVLRPPGHPGYPTALINLAGAITMRFEQSPDEDDLHCAKDLGEVADYLCKAEETLHTDHPLHVTVRRDLAFNCLKQHELQSETDHIARAFDLFEQAANHSTASAKARFTVAVEWATLSHDYKHESTVRAYSKSLTLLDRCLVACPTVESQHEFLATTPEVPSNLASNAAAGAIEMGQLEDAIELLEQGRTIVWSKMLGYRHSLKSLRKVKGGAKLADEFKSLSGQLENHVISSEADSPTRSAIGDTEGVAFEIKLRTYRMLSDKWECLLGEIREKEGFQNFLKAEPFTKLQTAANKGQVIIINASEYRDRVDALIFGATGPIDHVLLPNIDLETLTKLSDNILNRPTHASTTQQQNYTTHYLIPALRTIWDDILIPIFDKIHIPLVDTSALPQQQIWWYLTGPLMFIPIHAAGSRSGSIDVSQLVISSYVTTLESLLQARIKHMPLPAEQWKLLTVSQPKTPGWRSLPQTMEEVNEVVQMFGSAGWSKDNIICLHGSEATVDGVSSALNSCSWLHLACHGFQDLKLGMKSAFSLHDGYFELSEIASKQLSNGQFAFLSACQAASGLKDLPGEAMHLAAGFQIAGFPSVIATLWSICDDDAPKVAGHTYQYLFRNGLQNLDSSEAATALNRAILHLRKDSSFTVDRWAPFIHFGI